MQKSNIVKIDPDTKTISCGGDEDSLGHPKVYYTFDEQNVIVCEYCGTKFIKDQIIKKDITNV